jgi:PAS domain S-box-containing protein
MRGLEAGAWFRLAIAIATAVLLLRFPVQVFPVLDLSLAALPVLVVALLAGPLAGLLAAVATAIAATIMGSGTTLLGLLLLSAPVLGLAHARLAHPAFGCFIAPIATAALAALLGDPAVDRLQLATVGVLQSSINVILAFGVALLISSRRPYRHGGWAGRPLTHRLFVILATAATLLTAGMGLLSTIALQERQVATTLSNVHLLAQEIAESTQVQLRAQSRSLAAFGRSLAQSDLTAENDDLTRRIEAYTTGQSELLTVLLARADGVVIAAAATRPTLDPRAVLGNNVSDRDYFRGAIALGAPYVTDTFRGRGFGSDIIVAVSAPIYQERVLAGVIEGSLNLVQVAQVLDSASSRRGLDIVLVDRTNRVVAARGSRLLEAGAEYKPANPTYYRTDLPQMQVRQLSPAAELAAWARLEPYGWTVHVAQSVATLLPMFELQFQSVVRDMAVALLIVFAVSILFAGVLARPLGQFAEALTGDEAPGGPGGLLQAVRAAPSEIRRFALVLVRAQRRQRRSLARQQQLVADKDRLNRELQELNVALDEKVELRTAVLAEREQQLRASETRWRTMAEIAPDAVVVIDDSNTVQFANTAMEQLTQFKAADLVGQPLESIVPERLRRGHAHGLRRYLDTGVPKLNWRSTEALVQSKDGRETPVEIAFGEYTLEGRHFFAGYLRDITARKQHEAEVIRARDLAEAANHSKDSFLATMSHEIRTPLHGLIGTLDLMSRDSLDDSTAFRLTIARNSARSLLQIANDVLDLSGIEAGRVRIERVAFDLRDLMAAVCASFEPDAREKGLQLEHSIAGDVPGWVEGDPLRLRQVITNLVNNALKFTLQGRVALDVRRGEGDVVEFAVSDTGIGVPHDKREHIFERFAQAEDERTRRFGGAGLGLAISRLLARAMGGELSLAATGSTGSIFLLTLPLPHSHAAAEREASSVTIQRLALATGQATRVLVVDDNPANRYVVEAYLHELGVETVLAEGADLGLAELARQRFDLVLMDVQMPGKDGYQATSEIRQRFGPALPVVAMTANANIGERARCVAAGMNDLLVKPFDAVGLADLLHRTLAVAAANRADAEGASRHAAAKDNAALTPTVEDPLLETDSADSIVKRFAARPATLRKLYTALQESIVTHLDAIRLARAEQSLSVLTALHGMKGAAGMYGAKRLQREASGIEKTLRAGTAIDAVAADFDRLEQTGRLTVDAVRQLLESLASGASGDSPSRP